MDNFERTLCEAIVDFVAETHAVRAKHVHVCRCNALRHMTYLIDRSDAHTPPTRLGTKLLTHLHTFADLCATECEWTT